MPQRLPERLEAWRAAGETFVFGGHRIFYRTEGSGDPLLLLHGFPTASWDWHRIWDELTARFRVVAADMLGYGFSDKPLDHDYSFAEQADLQQALLERLGIGGPVDVLAHDYGDTVAQELLARQLDRSEGIRLRSVCLLNGGLDIEASRLRLIQRLLAGPLGPLVARFLGYWRFRRSFGAVFGPRTRPTEAEMREFWELVNFNDGRRAIFRVIRYLHERRRHRDRWVGALRRTEVPLRLVIGPADPISGVTIAARFREVVPDPDVVVLEEHVGHYPQIEAPAAVLAAFLDFVSGSESGLVEP